MGLLFMLLAARDLFGNHDIGIAAGYVGLFCGASAMYVAMAEVLGEIYGRKLLPY